MLADVNNDGRADIIGFGNDAVYVSLSTGTGFSLPERWLYSYGYDASAGGWCVDKHQRMMADVNNDGMADIVGFGEDAVYVALSQGTTFGFAERWLYSYGYGVGGWRVDKHPRMMVDVDNDGMADIVGFGNDAVYVS
ncbi:MAG: VCBS repeat-containing protein, partial [bacterium]